MNTIMADMTMPVSSGNGTPASKADSESGEFGEIMKTQSGQNKKNSGEPAKKEEQDKESVPVLDHVQPSVQPNAEGIAGNQQILNMLLIQGMPIPQVLTENVNAGMAEDGSIQINLAESAAPMAVSDNIDLGMKEPQEPQVAAAPDNQANVLQEPAAMVPQGANNRKIVDKAPQLRDVPSSGMDTAAEGQQDTGAEPVVLPESPVKSQGMQTEQLADAGSVEVQGKQAAVKVKSEIETSANEQQDKSYMQDVAMRGNVPESTAASGSATAGRAETKTDIRPEYMEQLKANIADSLAAGKREFEIQLNPANLGKLVIKATYEAGRAVISIVCSEARTMEAMSHQARELAAMVEDRTGNPTVVVVEHPAEDYLEQQGKQQENQQESHSGRQQNEEKKSAFHENFDFLQQLRLGLA